MDLVNQINYLQKQLDVSVKQLRKNGIAFAEAEKEYKVAVCKKALELKDNGMAVTLIQLCIYGYEEIALLRFKRDSAEVIYNANQEAINSIKLQLRILENQYDKEWSISNE